jgi:DNA polymerase-4
MQNDPGRQRKIIHVDMDAFYASVEQRDNPELRGRPVAVGGQHRGVVMVASYEARKYGIRSAMASVTAKRRCPELIFVKSHFDVYRAVSQQIRSIFLDYTDLVEPLSLDEAYLDVTGDRCGLGSARAIAEDIRRRIRAETGLTASAGVSYCKFIAKLASDHRKPDGLTVITPERGQEFVASLPVARFHGVGPVTARKMERLGIMTGADLQAWSLAQLQRISEARPNGIGGSRAGSTSARSSPTGPTSRSAPSARSTRICPTPTGSPPSSSGSRATPGTG